MDGSLLPAPSAPTGGGALGRLAARGLSRTSLAFWMIVVSAFGAAAAYWIAETEQASVALHRKLTRGQMLELSLRQQIVGDWGYRAALEARQREHNQRASALEAVAARLRPTDAAEAGRYDVQAQQEHILARLTGTLLAPFRQAPRDGELSANIDRQATVELGSYGFSRASATPVDVPRPAPAPATTRPARAFDAPPSAALTYAETVERRELPLWTPLSRSIEERHHNVPQLARGVVLFVVALVCLTAVDLLRRRVALANAALALGAMSAVGAMVAVLVWDLSAWRPFLAAGLFSALLTLVFRVAGLFGRDAHGETPHPIELERKGFLGVHLPLRHAADLREQLLVAIAAFTVLLSSVVGWWLADAQTQAGEATHRAFASEVQLNNLDGERWLSASRDLMTPTLELFQARVRCAFASQPVDPRTEGPDSDDAERDPACRSLGESISAKSAEAIAAADFDSGAFPGSSLVAAERHSGPFNAAYLYALADGYISEAEAWETNAATFVLGLTLFAVALYLTSQALGMGEGAPSTVLSLCGSALALVTFASAVVVHQRPIMATPSQVDPECRLEGSAIEGAATHYGRARALLERATSGADYEAAEQAFSCALAIRPDFSRAKYDRSGAAAQISQGDVDSEYFNFPTRDRVEGIREARAEAIQSLERDGWVVSPMRLNNLAFATILGAYTTGRTSRLDEAIVLLERAVVAGGLGTPAGVINAVALKAATADARESNQILFTNLGLARLALGQRESALKAYRAAVDGLDLARNRSLVAGTLSDLHVLEAHCVALHGSQSTTCGDVAAGLKDVRRLLLHGGSVPDGPQPTLADIRVEAHASRVRWQAKASGFRTGRDSLHVVWSEYSEEWRAWRVVQPLFGMVDLKLLEGSPDADISRLYERSPSYCLPSGRYRAEFFINGEVVRTPQPLEVDAGGYRNYRSRELDVALCIPDSWTRTTLKAEAGRRDLVHTFTNANGRRTLYLMTLFMPIEGFGWTDRALDRALTALTDLFRVSERDIREGVARFEGCGRPILPGAILPRVWREADGLVHVALVVADEAPSDQACQVLESIGSYYARSSDQLFGRNGDGTIARR
jgi:tetratricopeptide (TPR) repeat protein